jgi:hypothetical protein
MLCELQPDSRNPRGRLRYTATTQQENDLTQAFDDSGSSLMSRERQDELLDQALEETFPASDPISPMCPLSFD